MSPLEDAQGIAWREWGEEAFEAAKVENKPVLLTLGATWCHWCHVMDHTSYSDERVIGLVNSRFIPIRVDVDQRPDISLRYNQGGFPSVAFLAASGEFITGRPYTPPEEMVNLLQPVSAGETPAPDVPAGGGPTAANGRKANGSVDAVQDRLLELYDEEFGGFGVEPKQPPWEALQFLTSRYGRSGDRDLLGMVEATLLGMWHGIYDRKDQGFFRYSVSRDWKVPHYEKMLVSNASLARVYLEGYQITGKAIYRTAVEGILKYLLNSSRYPPAKPRPRMCQPEAVRLQRTVGKPTDQLTRCRTDCWNSMTRSLEALELSPNSRHGRRYSSSPRDTDALETGTCLAWSKPPSWVCGTASMTGRTRASFATRSAGTGRYLTTKRCW